MQVELEDVERQIDLDDCKMFITALNQQDTDHTTPFTLEMNPLIGFTTAYYDYNDIRGNIFLNCISAGVGDDERVGDEIDLVYLRIRGHLTWFVRRVTWSELNAARLVVVYFPGGRAAMNAISFGDLFAHPDSSHPSGFVTHFLDPLKRGQTHRAVVLYDEVYVFDSYMGSQSTTVTFRNHVPFEIELDLRGLTTKFSRDASPIYREDISHGALALFAVSQINASVSGGQGKDNYITMASNAASAELYYKD